MITTGCVIRSLDYADQGKQYGGFHGPGTIEYFERQNERIQEGFIGDKNVVKLPIDTLGITNGTISILWFIIKH